MDKDNQQSQTSDFFNMVLASTVHDMKNSLGMLGESLNHILAEIDIEKLNPELKNSHTVVQYESARVNNSLMQLLALYKLESNQLPFNPNYVNLADFLDEQKIKHSPLLEAKNISCQIDVDESIEAFFDECLIGTLLDNIIGNAVRYTKHQIIISGWQKNSQIKISVSDDGSGYPQEMIEMQGDYMLGINQSTGSTGLGLFFAQQIAAMHQHKGKGGEINLANNEKLAGGHFCLTLP